MDEFLLEKETGAGSGDHSAEFYLATVTAWSSADGVAIRLDGQDAAMTKRYKTVLACMPPAVGDRVVVMKLSGTYVVLGKIGKPNADVYFSATFSDFAEASADFTVTGANLVISGRVASLWIGGTWNKTVSSSSTETVAFTMKSGFRPKVTSLARAWRNPNAILSWNGNMSYTGAFNQGDNYTFLATYIIA